MICTIHDSGMDYDEIEDMVINLGEAYEKQTCWAKSLIPFIPTGHQIIERANGTFVALHTAARVSLPDVTYTENITAVRRRLAEP